MWPAWMWAKDPSKRILGASYGEELAIRDSMKCRDIVTSAWYQELWPDVAIKQGDDQKIKYGLTGGGWRLATSVGGRATGEHPDIKIVDDPHSAAQANSDAERNRAIEWFDGTLSTRGVSRGAKTVVVMQRLHEKDVSGHILEDIGGYEHLCLPMRYEKNAYTYKYDKRTELGDLLWPALFDDDTVTILQKRLGEYGAAGQLQQQPAPPGGGILRTENLKLWPAERTLPQFQFILQSLDTAFTEKTSGDPTACTVWGVFSEEGRQSVLLLDSWAEHLSYPNLREKVIMEWAATYGGDPKDTQNKSRRADLMLIEDKGSGISLIQDLQRAGIGVRKYNPGRTDKIGRAHQFAPMLELGVIYIPESRRVPGDFISWAKPLVAEMEKFPNGAHDDLTDTTTSAFIYLRDSRLLELAYSQVIDEEVEVDYHAKRTRVENPYLI
jgi:predicted phage terminase large subunit-like protein